MTNNIFDDKLVKKILQTFFVLSIALLIIMINLVYKISEEEVCINKKYSLNEKTNAFDLVISDNTTYSQKYSISDYKPLKTKFCSYVDVNTLSSVEIIVSNNGVSDTQYLFNGSDQFVCNTITNSSEDSFIAFSCPNCDGSNNISVTRSLDKGLLLVNSVPNNDYLIHYSSINQYDCKRPLKNYFKWYFWIIPIIGFLYLVVTFFEWFYIKYLLRGL